MFRPREFEWTSRADVCVTLIRFLQQPHPRSAPSPIERQRNAAAALLAHIATPDLLPDLRQLLRDPGEDSMVRVWALRAFALLDASLAPEDVPALMDDPDLGWEIPSDQPPKFGHSRCGYLQDVVALCRAPETVEAACRYLEQRTALDRASLLMVAWTPWEHPLTPMETWLYQRWRDSDWLALERLGEEDESLNVDLAAFTHIQEPSRALLIEAWRAASGPRRQQLRKELPEDTDGALTRATAHSPEERRELAEAFRLAPATLLAHFGLEAALFERIEATIRAADESLRRPVAERTPTSNNREKQTIISFHVRNTPLSEEDAAAEPAGVDHGELIYWIEPEASSDPAERAPEPANPRKVLHWDTDFGAALRVLEELPSATAGERIATLVSDPNLNVEVQRRLLRVLWNRDRQRATVVAREDAKRGGEPMLLRWVLQEIAWEPRPEDHDFVLRTLGSVSDDECSYFAIEGLAEIEATSAVSEECLAQLARAADVGVRLQALAALARHGDKRCVAHLIHAGTRGKSVRVRAEAVRLLGRLDANRFFDLFERALMAGSTLYDDGYHAPIAEEAARALIRIDTPAARTALLRGYLVSHSHPLDHIIETYFEALAAREDGREAPEDLPPHDWRPCWWPELWP